MNNKKIIAITGPSGSGKSTIASLLCENLGAVIPKHCTTRKPRKDDAKDFYRYLTHDEFNSYLNNNSFLIASGDAETVAKENGNFYGVLYEDYNNCLLKNDLIIIFASYKDIDKLEKLKKSEANIIIINLTFSNIESGIKSRIDNNPMRNHRPNDIIKRIESAQEDNLKYGKKVRKLAECNVYTDLLSIDETFNVIVSCL